MQHDFIRIELMLNREGDVLIAGHVVETGNRHTACLLDGISPGRIDVGIVDAAGAVVHKLVDVAEEIVALADAVNGGGQRLVPLRWTGPRPVATAPMEIADIGRGARLRFVEALRVAECNACSVRVVRAGRLRPHWVSFWIGPLEPMSQFCDVGGFCT